MKSCQNKFPMSRKLDRGKLCKACGKRLLESDPPCSVVMPRAGKVETFGVRWSEPTLFKMARVSG